MLNANGTVTYTPAANYNGTDAFTYTIADGHGGTATASVALTITADNDAPTAAKYFHLTRAHHMARNARAARAALARANAAGLTAERLHPAERGTYRQLVAELQP